MKYLLPLSISTYLLIFSIQIISFNKVVDSATISWEEIDLAAKWILEKPIAFFYGGGLIEVILSTGIIPLLLFFILLKTKKQFNISIFILGVFYLLNGIKVYKTYTQGYQYYWNGTYIFFIEGFTHLINLGVVTFLSYYAYKRIKKREQKDQPNDFHSLRSLQS